MGGRRLPGALHKIAIGFQDSEVASVAIEAKATLEQPAIDESQVYPTANNYINAPNSEENKTAFLAAVDKVLSNEARGVGTIRTLMDIIQRIEDDTMALVVLDKTGVAFSDIEDEEVRGQTKVQIETLVGGILFEQLKLIEVDQKIDKKRIFYTGFALWGGEKWAIGDAIKLGLAFENFYRDRTFLRFIFSNNEVDFLPKKYPTVFEDVVAQHVDYLRINSRVNDLIIIGLYSHGLEEKLIIRLGKEATHAVNPNALKKFLDPISKKNVLLIISACHAGSFIPHLISDNIAIAVAAAAVTVAASSGMFAARPRLDHVVARLSALLLLGRSRTA